MRHFPREICVFFVFLCIFMSLKAYAEQASPPDPPELRSKNQPRKTTPISLTSLSDNFDASYKKLAKSERVALNFQNIELAEFVRSISLMTGKRFIIGPKVREIKASVYSPTPVTKGEAYRAFLSVLALNGMTTVTSGRFVKIVNSDESDPPICTDGENCPAGDRMTTRLHQLRHVTAQDITQVLDRFKSNAGEITAYSPTNTVIVSDYSTNIRRMMRIVQELDVPGLETQVWIHPIYHADAAEVAELIRETFPPQRQSSPAKTQQTKRRTRSKRRGKQAAKTSSPGRSSAAIGQSSTGDSLDVIIADERTNQLIIVASEATYYRIVSIIRRIDLEQEDDGEIRVHRLENADAEALAAVLKGVAAETKNLASRKGGKTSQRRTQSGKGSPVLGGELGINADKSTNSLVITGSTRDYMSLKRVIDELDAPRKQVFVEAVIMEVSEQGLRDIGVSFHGGDTFEVESESVQGDGLRFGGTKFGTTENPFSSLVNPAVLQGLALGVVGPEIEMFGGTIPSFGIIVQALQTSSDVNVLSTPHLLALDHEPAEIHVGQNVPISTSFAGNLGGLSSLVGGDADTSSLSQAASLFPTQNIQRQNVGIKLAITPHINQSDQVRMEIEVEVSEIADVTNATLPTIGQRVIKTKCIMGDQQTVVLGGLVTDHQFEGGEKIPVLGDIPILGRLFRRTSSRSEKRNLLVFVTPYIIRDDTDFRRIYSQKMEERREFVERMQMFNGKNYRPHVDYSRTNGLLEEINLAVVRIEEEEALQSQLEDIETPVHSPQAPVESAAVDEDVAEPLEPGSEVIDARAEISEATVTVDTSPSE